MNRAEALEAFDGVMLGDGGLILPVRGIRAHFHMTLSGKPEAELIDYLRSVAGSLEDLGVQVSLGYPKVISSVSHGKPYNSCILLTLSSNFLTDQYHRWYRRLAPKWDIRKEAPEDLMLTPTSLAHWFMGDGGSSLKSTGGIYVALATHGFNTDSVGRLEHQLSSMGVSTGRSHDRRTRRGSGIVITVRQESVNYFMETIEPYIVRPYKYKIKYRR